MRPSTDTNSPDSLVSSGAVIGEGPSRRHAGVDRFPRPVVAIVAAVLMVVAIVCLGGQAFRGNRTVGVQRDAHTVHDAAIDNAFYNCLAVQGHSLVAPGESVALSAPATFAGLADTITLLKGVGGWATFANPPSTASVTLSLRDNVAVRGACLGTQVIGTYPRGNHKVIVRVGTGASVPGKGPPPAPPL
jgi:hypothetical protein